MDLLDPLFGSETVTQIFSSGNTIQRMLDVEAALARAESNAGVIPPSAAESIAAKCHADLFDPSALAKAAALAGNLAIPLVKQLTALVSASDKDAARYVHWGATSQDVIDTALILQARAALDHIDSELASLCEALARLADQHRSTPAVARTWMQHAVATTLGLKVAGWLDALKRHCARIHHLHHGVLALQFGGAAGTLASLGDHGLAVAGALAEELSLALPDLPWHAHRDRVAEIATTLALLVGTLGKIARDVSLLSQTEVGELSEPAAEGRGGSSTMPQKQNPVSCAVVLAAAVRVPGLTSTMLISMLQENERALGGWHAEWETLPEIFRLTAGAVHHMLETISGLQIDSERMRENLEQTHGLIFGEAVVMALARHMGKSQAHNIVECACRHALAEKRHLRDVLREQPEVAAHLKENELDKLFAAQSSTGMAEQFIDRVLSSMENR